MTDEHNPAHDHDHDHDHDDEGADGLCDHDCRLEEDELTGDDELPPATGGVAE